MRILTWNINGIRSVKKELGKLIQSAVYDIICIQETKVTRDQLNEDSAIIDGYNSYFSFSRGRSGYSGVATFVKNSCTPIKAEEGLSGLLVPDDVPVIKSLGDQSQFSEEEIRLLDNEGRTVITQHRIIDEDGNSGLLAIVNVYCPRADPENKDRKIFKIRFYELLQVRVEAILKSGSHVILLGDMNTSHTKLDNCDPGEDKEFYSNPARRWLNQFLWDPERDGHLDKIITKSERNGSHFVDVFRFFHPLRPDAFTCWSTMTGSRATNYGTRIDYILADIELMKRAFTSCDIMPEVFGSDHCPVQATFDWEILPCKKCPHMCTKFMPEFAGKQQKLLTFFTKKDLSSDAGIQESPDLHSSQESVDSDITTGCCTNAQQHHLGEESLTFSQDSNKQQVACSEVVTKKRNSNTLSKDSTKKVKKDDNKSTQGKQGNLLAFFRKKVPREHSQIYESKIRLNETLPRAQTDRKVVDEDSVKSISEVKPPSNSASASWKSLLKGPPPPPLCKGHQEPCVLRTVKKDSLNKGRQFWTCARPEGHKSNPGARCDFFMWVDKMKV